MEKKYKIFYGTSEFNASEYQNKIFQTIESGVGNLVINAAAGSSKTTTIVNAIRFIPETKKILFVAFNKDIVEKIKEQVSHPNIKVSTFHSIAYSILVENNIIRAHTHDISGLLDTSRPDDLERSELLNEYKYKNFIKKNIDLLTRYQETKSLGKRRNIYISNITKLVEYSRYYLAFTVKEIEKVAETYDITPVRDEFEVCREVLLWGEKNTDTIDYTDLIWLPTVLNLVTKKHQFNWIFIDEAQDTSIAEQALIEKCFKRGTRFAAVMDEFQQINIWAGSTLDAIDNFKKYSNTKEYKLPISYRCPKKIVELASQYSDNIIAADNAIDGEIRYDVSVNEPVSGDMVLCRTTAPLVEQFLKYLRCNKKAYIRGFENNKQNYLEHIQSTNSFLIDKNCITSDGLFPKLYIQLFELMERIKNSFNLDDQEVLLHPSVLMLYDDIEALKYLSEGLTNTSQLVEKINIIFNGDSDDAIQLSTIHKAKGLEANNVYILYPSLMPSPLATKDWEIKTENNLIYVAYTRAKKTLNFIAEDTRHNVNNGYFNMINMVSSINEMKKKLNYNKEIRSTEDNFSSVSSGNTNVRQLGEKDNTQQPLNTQQKKNNKAGLKFKSIL